MFLDEFQKEYLKKILDESLESFGKICKLVYQPRYIDCQACNFSTIGNKPNSVWQPGNPSQILGCVFCGGTGKKPVEVSEQINLILVWNPSQFLKPAAQVESPYDVIQSRGAISNLPKILRCIEMHTQLPIEPYMKARYILDGQPNDQFNILQNTYFIATWRRIK